jgi:hypothetical protein
MGLQWLRLLIRQDDLQCFRGLLFWNQHLPVFFLLDNNLRCGSRGGDSSRGGSIFSVIIVFILVMVYDNDLE